MSKVTLVAARVAPVKEIIYVLGLLPRHTFSASGVPRDRRPQCRPSP